MYFSDDFKFLYLKNDDGSISGIPVSTLNDDEKQYAYEQIAKQGYS